jgi:NTE family protein
MVAFVQSRNALDPRDWAHDPTIVPRQVELTPRHVLASAAIPLLFPAVRIENAFYSDGSLRLNTPLAPATHLGADRILVVTTKPEKSRPVQDLQPLEGPLSFFTRMLSAPLIDQLETDLGRMRFINKILETGEAAYGPDFLARLNRVSAESGDARTYRRIDDLVLRPSRDPSAMAAELLESTKMRERVPGLVRRLLDTSTGAGILRQRDALSVLLFEPEYIEALMELGRSDARAHERALVEFFSAEAREPANAAS